MVKQHNSKAIRKMFHKLEIEGFRIAQRKSGGYRIDPPSSNKNTSPYYTHGTESSLHHMRRDFKKRYNVDLN